jgi:hypothetical protein
MFWLKGNEELTFPIRDGTDIVFCKYNMDGTISTRSIMKYLCSIFFMDRLIAALTTSSNPDGL